MAGANPTTGAQRWADHLGASTERIKEGVQAVTAAPGQLAAKQQDVWAANVAASKAKWAAKTGAVSLATWQQDMLTKGVDRIATGAQAAKSKFEQFLGRLIPYIATQKASLPPRGSFEQNLNRMTAFVRGMHNFKG